MKATGIVRRIEAYGIIGQKSKQPHEHRVFRWFSWSSIYTNTILHNKSGVFSLRFIFFAKVGGGHSV